MAMGAIGQAHAGLVAPKTMYLDETVIRSPADPAFAAYWSDEANVIATDRSRMPVVRTGYFTDADGRRLVVTMIDAFPLCNISGCPVRIQTEQGEKLLDRVYACDLAEDHHLSADGRIFIACDDKFPIPKTTAGASQLAKGAGPASDFVPVPPPETAIVQRTKKFRWR